MHLQKKFIIKITDRKGPKKRKTHRDLRHTKTKSKTDKTTHTHTDKTNRTDKKNSGAKKARQTRPKNAGSMSVSSARGGLMYVPPPVSIAEGVNSW